MSIELISVLIAIVLAALLLVPSAAGQDVVALPLAMQRFHLFNQCKPMALLVELEPGEGVERIGLGLAAADLKTALEARLRSARLYTKTTKPEGLLYLNVDMVAGAFRIDLEYNKFVTDVATGGTGLAATWEVGSVGTHGENKHYIVSAVAGHMDEFLVAYLRVNEAACGQP